MVKTGKAEKKEKAYKMETTGYLEKGRNTDTEGLRALDHIRIPSISDPFEIDIYWFQSHIFGNDPSTFFFKPHTHSFVEIHFILEGEASYRVNEHLLTACGGEFILIPAGLSHTQEAVSKELVRLSLSFDIIANPNNPLSRTTADTLALVNPFCGRLDDCILSTISHICIHARQASAYTPYVIRNDVFGLIIHVCDQVRNQLYRPYDPIQNGVTDIRCIRAKQFIEDNVASNIKTADVAKYVHLSARQLGRIFEQFEGKSVFEYIQERRCQLIKKILLSENVSLREISERLGFSDEFYFNRYFSKHTGITPTKFRKINGTKLQNKE